MLVSNFKSKYYIHIFFFFKIISFFSTRLNFINSNNFSNNLSLYFFLNFYYKLNLKFIFKIIKFKKYWVQQYYISKFNWKLKLNYFQRYLINSNLKLIILSLNWWHIIQFKINIKLVNNDLKLLNREFLLFLSISIKRIHKLYIFTQNIKQKRLSLLRSPFVYNKSHEQFALNTFSIDLKSRYNQYNLLLFLYFIKWSFIVFRYSLVKLVKIIQMNLNF